MCVTYNLWKLPLQLPRLTVSRDFTPPPNQRVTGFYPASHSPCHGILPRLPLTVSRDFTPPPTHCVTGFYPASHSPVSWDFTPPPTHRVTGFYPASHSPCHGILPRLPLTVPRDFTPPSNSPCHGILLLLRLIYILEQKQRHSKWVHRECFLGFSTIQTNVSSIGSIG